MAYKAIIVGASGLIGSNLLQQLLQQPDYDEVLIMVRKGLQITHPKLKQAIVNFNALDKYAALITGHALFCCLGTTNHKTPDKAVYRKIDHDYPVQLAQLASQKGVEEFHLVSAVGANASSSQFYLKTKGETERDVKKTGVKALHIYQPSFLVGDRADARLGEKIAGAVLFVLDPLLIGGLKKFRSIKASTVARAMLNQSLINKDGIFVHPSDQIKELA
ncbi:MAG: NAD-dependent epimerase/dehydratase family protein [Sphingobacteriaceae bacterium]|nr:MAG: NAD-dependent epimerase/dehydratase family protein [Sphingobacteriaceae bacterium]